MAATTRSGGLGWTSAVIGAANTPASILGLAFATAGRALQRKRMRYGLAVAAAVGLVVVDTELRLQTAVSRVYLQNDHGFRTVLPYSGRPGFSYPVFFGLLSILLSFGKGVLFFAPGLLLPVRARLRSAGHGIWRGYQLWIVFVAGLIVAYAPWWAWYGGEFWGPRFFLFASLPASLAIAARLRYPGPSLGGRAVTAGVLALSVWVGISATVFNHPNVALCVQHHYALEHLCWYVPEFSALWRPFVHTQHLSGLDILYLLFAMAVLARMLHAVFSNVLTAAAADFTRLRDFATQYRHGWRV